MTTNISIYFNNSNGSAASRTMHTFVQDIIIVCDVSQQFNYGVIGDDSKNFSWFLNEYTCKDNSMQ